MRLPRHFAFKLLLTSGFFVSIWSYAFPASSSDARFSCQSSLDAMRLGRASSIVESELQGRAVSPSEMQVFTEEAQSGLDRMQQVGGGLPIRLEKSMDLTLTHGETARINVWPFPNGIVGYAGCVRYLNEDGVPTSVIRMNSDLGGLERELSTIVANRSVLDH